MSEERAGGGGDGEGGAAVKSPDEKKGLSETGASARKEAATASRANVAGATPTMTMSMTMSGALASLLAART